MYKSPKYHQISFYDFNQSCGLQLDETNEWVVLADHMEWEKMEEESGYAKNFPSTTGRPAKPFRMVLGALVIQKHKNLSDRKLVKEIAENPYLQYFIGCGSYQKQCPFKASALVSFRQRIDADCLMEVNEIFLETGAETPEHAEKGKRKKTSEETKEGENAGTAILDATCSPSHIKYPQDFALLNEGRRKLETMIDFFHKEYHPWKKPRTYRRVAQQSYLSLAKSKKRTARRIRQEIRRQLEHVRRDLGYLAEYMAAGYALPSRYIGYYLTILKMYEQQKYMYENHTHQVADRIVSISQPNIRPIVRGKAAAPVEFGAKYDVSIDEKGHARLEKISFTPYNESTVFQDAMDRYHKRTGHYPERALVDKIYRTADNLRFCKEHGIRMSGPKLGRPKEAEKEKQKKIAKRDNKDRIEVERFFSLEKRCNGAGLIMTRLDKTTLVSIALSVLVTNLFSVPIATNFLFYFMDDGENYGFFHLMQYDDAA